MGPAHTISTAPTNNSFPTYPKDTDSDTGSDIELEDTDHTGLENTEPEDTEVEGTDSDTPESVDAAESATSNSTHPSA